MSTRPRPHPPARCVPSAGRLYQVEYAIAAIQNAAAAVGIQTKAGIVIATEKRVASKLLAPPKTSEKVYKLDEHVRGERELCRAGAGGGLVAACLGLPASWVSFGLADLSLVSLRLCVLPPPPPAPAQIFAAVAGLTSDANILVQYARTAAQRYR